MLTISLELKSTVSHLTGLPKGRPDPASLHLRRVEHTLLESWQATTSEAGNNLLENRVFLSQSSIPDEPSLPLGRSVVEYGKGEVQLPHLPFFLFSFINFPWKYNM